MYTLITLTTIWIVYSLYDVRVHSLKDGLKLNPLCTPNLFTGVTVFGLAVLGVLSVLFGVAFGAFAILKYFP